MAALKLFFLQIMLFLAIAIVRAEKVMRPKVKDMKIWDDNVHIKHSVAFDPLDPHINITIDVLQELNDVDLHVEGALTQKNDPHYFWHFNSTFNLCRLLNWRNASPVGTLVHAYLKEYGNLAEKCPIPKARYTFHKHLSHKLQGQYYIHRFWIPEDPAMSEFPEVDFDIRISSQHLDANKMRTPIADDHFTGEVIIQDVTNVKRGILAMLPKAG